MVDTAFALHSILHNKHASHLNSKYVDNAKAAFKYQQTFDAEPSGTSSQIYGPHDIAERHEIALQDFVVNRSHLRLCSIGGTPLYETKGFHDRTF
jgi:hypothetical protein